MKEDTKLLQNMFKIVGYKNVEKKASILLNKYGSIENILSKENDFILNDDNINERFLLLRNLLLDFSNNRYYDLLFEVKEKILNVKNVIEYLRRQLATQQNERVVVIFLTRSNEIILYEEISKGTLDSSNMDIKYIIKKCIFLNAKSIIIAHNHPSGSLGASSEDIYSTKRLKEALRIFQLELVDHIIISKYGYYSFVEGGII